MGQCLIGIWPNGLTPEIAEHLEPAARLGRCRIETGPGWSLWTVHEGGKLIAAANVRRTVEPAVEVVLVGGHRSRKWIADLDRMIGLWAKDEGAKRLRAFGRRGWVRILCRQGWEAVAEEYGVTEYERRL